MFIRLPQDGAEPLNSSNVIRLPRHYFWKLETAVRLVILLVTRQAHISVLWNLMTSNLNDVTLSKNKKGPIRRIMGPWIQGGQRGSHSGEAAFGSRAALDFMAFHQRWFDHWLKGIDNGVDREPPVGIFVMGGGDAHKTPEGRLFVGGHWRNENEWPLARAVTKPYYIHADGSLSPTKAAADKSGGDRHRFRRKANEAER